MKKIYSAPAMQVNETQVVSMVALSLMDGEASSAYEVLSKEEGEAEEGAWNIWGK